MLAERARQRIATVQRNAGGNAEVGQALAAHPEGEAVLESLKARKPAIRLDHHARAGSRRARLLELGHELLEVDRAAALLAADADIRINDQYRLDEVRQTLEQALDGAGLVPVHAVIEATPARLAQALQGVIGRTVADE